jgi:hypothetical protein
LSLEGRREVGKLCAVAYLAARDYCQATDCLCNRQL